MSSKATIYRQNNPEYYKLEQQRKNEREKLQYQNDPVYKQRKIDQAKARYLRKKQLKLNESSSSNESNDDSVESIEYY